MDQVGGKADPQTGRYGVLHWTGIEDDDRVTEIIRALYRSAKYVNVSLPYPEKVKAEDGTTTLVIQPADKRYGRKHQVRTHGPDRSAWAYDPRKKDAA
jgi:hypothetical protein